MTKPCPYCDQPIDDNVTTCPHCGKHMLTSFAPATPETPAHEAIYQYVRNKDFHHPATDYAALVLILDELRTANRRLRAINGVVQIAAWVALIVIVLYLFFGIVVPVLTFF